MLSNARLSRQLMPVCLIAMFAWWGTSIDGFAQGQASKGGTATISPSESTSLDSVMLQDLANAAKAPKPTNESAVSPGIDFLSLLLKGGVFMIPIGLVSLIVVMFLLERLVGLRSAKLLPRSFVRKIVQLSRESDSIDPRVAYKLCMAYPSAASNVVAAMLLRAGRPQQEVQAAAVEVNQREADKAYGGVRWLHFSAGVAPLLGLLGTVWGLIRAFHDLTLLGPTQSRADFLGRGIYEALVTTLAGLVVAIPAALAAHYFEGRITRVFRTIEELVFTLIPKLERYEGRVRFDPIGRELVARNIETTKKTSTTNSEASSATTAPPVQASSTPPSHTHVTVATPARKAISKP